MISMKKALVVLAVAAAMSGCGRDDYNGKYVGYEEQVGNNQMSGAWGAYQPQVELNLSQDGDIVSGTVSYPETGMTGQFSASSENSNRLDNVEIRVGNSGQMYNGGYNMPNMMTGACMGVFRGGLDAPADGKRLTGTLTASNSANSAFGYSMCTGKHISVTKQK